MADSSAAHLEKMGRELKCPICLSLLNSAVSLTCNHVFCNLCIMKSMKSDSHCPVCKVPFSRREVRPAPHMDSLVNIYESMEVDLGINIFVTQTAPCTKTSVTEGGNFQAAAEQISGRPATSGSSRKKQKSKRKPKMGGSKKMVENTSDPQLSMNPSFPAKKRVHVPQGNPFETPVRRGNGQGKLGERAEKEAIDNKIVSEKQSTPDAKKEPALSPFFWLREEDEDDDGIERLSNDMEVDDNADTPVHIVPSFSDIKDSEDCSPTKMDPHGKVCTPSKLADVLDSEMFEWTQKACSPELFSTPVKDKEECKAGSQEWSRCNQEETVSENRNEQTNANQISNNTKAQRGRMKFNTQSKKISGTKRKHAKVSAVEICEVPLDSIPEGLSPVSKFTGNGVVLRKKTKKWNTKVSSTISVKKVAEDISAPSNEGELENQENKNISAELTDLHGGSSEINFSLKHRTRKCAKKISNCQGDDSKSSKNQIGDTVVVGVLEEVSINQYQENESAKKRSSLLPCPRASDKKATGLKKKISDKENIKNTKEKGVGELRKNKRLKMLGGDDAEAGLSDVLNRSTMETVKTNQSVPGHKEDLQIKTADNSESAKSVSSASKNMFLQKCGSIQGPTCCSFCQSSTDSKASGEMMHYLNGRPIGPDFNEQTNIIHSHRNCTEWAPNVYFEDDIAINLQSELARSKRIKCSCCGIKGAALGCYEKSCRKSFHVPCAKLVPECRWDTENFVMLCPLHPSSKLPKEILGFQRKSPKQSLPKRESQGTQAKVMVQAGGTTCCFSKGFPYKLVLCCSGITVVEKEVVSKFTRMTGVSLSKSFDPSVTHIIASTNEDGACKRTLKVLMGILQGKWILRIDWVEACMKALEPVAEENYEISVDTHGSRDGPPLGRQRVLNKQPKLFEGLNFYFMGEFVPAYKGYLEDLAVAAGGTVLHRKPISGNGLGSTTFILYNAELPDKCSSGKKIICNNRQDEAEAVASLNGARVAAHSWVLDSIAACKLQVL